MFIAVLFITAKIWEQLKCLSVDKWMKTLWWTYVYNRTLFIHEKKRNPATCSNMDEAC